MNENEEVYKLTPWGCMSIVLEDYGIPCDHITGTIGNHLVEDFMDMMVKQGHVCKKEEDV